MQPHKGVWKGIILLVVLQILFSSCNTTGIQPVNTTVAPAATILLTPYIKSNKTPTPPPMVEGTATLLPSPSPTPLTHTVTTGETFGTIAVKFGITVDALIIANPTVNPNALPVGTVLNIPANGTVSSVLPTPLPITLQAPDCYQDPANRIICFVVANNPSGSPIEGVSAALRYQAADGSMKETIAYSLLNNIPAGGSVPLYAVFPAYKDWDGNMAVELKTAIPAPASDQSVTITVNSTEIGESGTSATVSGIIASQGGSEVSYWVLLVSRNSSGKISGARRFTVAIPSGEVSTKFTFQIFSMREKIASVEVLAEPAP